MFETHLIRQGTGSGLTHTEIMNMPIGEIYRQHKLITEFWEKESNQ